MKPHHIQALKEIAILGAIHDHISVSTKELGRILGISQQSASKRVLELVQQGLITRDLGVRGQRIKLSLKGMELLRKEYADYERILEIEEHLMIQGIVTTGSGEGHYYVQQKGYKEQFKNRLWFEPYEGTLNLKIKGRELSKLQILREAEGIIVKGFESGDRSFGDVKCFLATLSNIDCAVIMPVRSHHTDVLEVISKHHLRRTLGLENGDLVELLVTL